MSERRRVWLVGVLGCLVASSACVPQGVPTWAMHVRPGKVVVAADPNEVAKTLTMELGYPRLAVGHVSPEQIALVAVRELEHGRLVDAGLWLSIASYRYHQEAIMAFENGKAGFRTMPYGVPVGEYKKLVQAEISRFADLEFSDEEDAITARLMGRDEKVVALEEQLATLGKTNPIDRESLRGLWSELRPTKDPASSSHYPALAGVYRTRLLRDAAADPEDHNPANFLGRVPLPDFKREAVHATGFYFEPLLCVGIAGAFPTLRPAMIAALSAKRPQSRSNAAAALALAPTDETRALLQERLAVETDPNVKLVFSYALVRHGATEQALPLTTALDSCKGEGCTLPIMLVQWLPSVVKADVPQAAVARVLSAKAEGQTRIYAAAALRSIGREKALEPATIEALIKAARFKIEHVEQLQTIAAEAVGESAVLSRADVLARLERREDAVHPCALLARLAKVALVDDLPLLKRLMSRFGKSEGPEPFFVLEGMLSVRGADADKTLIAWFERYERQQVPIVVGLLARDSVPRATIRALVAEHGNARAEIVVKVSLKDADTPAKVVELLASDDVQDNLHAAELAGLTGQTGARPHLRGLIGYFDARYYPNDALLRHVAMAALVRLALLGTKPATPRPAPPAPPVEDTPPTAAASASPAPPTPAPPATTAPPPSE